MKLILGDCLEKMTELGAESVHSIITDPPYGLSFMGKEWDYGIPGKMFWIEALRISKPGAHLLAFGGTRTYHRLAVAIEDAGWEIRDCVMWVYGSGFPKSLDVSKAIDKAAGVERTEVVAVRHRNVKPFDDENGWNANGTTGDHAYTAPATDAAKQWAGWGTALKPAYEPIIVARKPLVGTVAENVLKHGTGAINVDGCRVGTETIQTNRYTPGRDMTSFHGSQAGNEYASSTHSGRWPANLIHDGSEEVVGLTGEAARFFYCAKASKRDRNEGLDDFQPKRDADRIADDGAGGANPRNRTNTAKINHHPTVKPTDLMRYLCRLVTPPSGIVLDPFMGSGSTGKAALLEGFDFIGIEKESEYLDIAKARIKKAEEEKQEQLL